MFIRSLVPARSASVYADSSPSAVCMVRAYPEVYT